MYDIVNMPDGQNHVGCQYTDIPNYQLLLTYQAS